MLQDAFQRGCSCSAVPALKSNCVDWAFGDDVLPKDGTESVDCIECSLVPSTRWTNPISQGRENGWPLLVENVEALKMGVGSQQTVTNQMGFLYRDIPVCNAGPLALLCPEWQFLEAEECQSICRARRRMQAKDRTYLNSPSQLPVYLWLIFNGKYSWSRIGWSVGSWCCVL